MEANRPLTPLAAASLTPELSSPASSQAPQTFCSPKRPCSDKKRPPSIEGNPYISIGKTLRPLTMKWWAVLFSKPANSYSVPPLSAAVWTSEDVSMKPKALDCCENRNFFPSEPSPRHIESCGAHSSPEPSALCPNHPIPSRAHFVFNACYNSPTSFLACFVFGCFSPSVLRKPCHARWAKVSASVFFPCACWHCARL